MAGLWFAPARGTETGPNYGDYVFSTFAGAGASGAYSDGPGRQARFYRPKGLTVSPVGELWVADSGTDTIRRISTAGDVATVAGVPFAENFANGPGGIAMFQHPTDVAIGPNGEAYVADFYNQVVRKISIDGTVSTFAGLPGVTGSADGIGSAARFNHPQGVAVDAAGTVYVTDKVNQTIRKITPAGEVTTLAGKAGVFGYVNGPGAVARFWDPVGIAADAIGNVYIAEPSRYTIRKITPAGDVSTLAGTPNGFGHRDGAANQALFNYPLGVDVDGEGNVYVADSDNHVIRKISGGVVTTVAGMGKPGNLNGAAAASAFHYPFAVAVDRAGGIFVADTTNNAIRRISSGTVSTYAGNTAYADGQGLEASFNRPGGIAMDRQLNLYIADTLTSVIRKITPSGAVSTLAGDPGPGGSGYVDGVGSAAKFLYPRGLCCDSAGNLYVADMGNSLIRKVTPEGKVTTAAGIFAGNDRVDGPALQAKFSGPSGVAMDAAGNVFIADTFNNAVRRLSPDGMVTTYANPGGAYWQTIVRPRGIALSADGKMYVTSISSVMQVNPDGTARQIAGGSVRGAMDGTGSEARFAEPDGIAIDKSGNIYVADTLNSAIRKITPAGVVSTIGGLLSETYDLENPDTGELYNTASGYVDGPGSLALFFSPTGLVVDPTGQLYVVEKGNAAVRRGLAIWTTRTSRLVNLSVRSRAGAEDKTLIMGFVVQGSSSKPVLVRGLGPALTGLGVTGALADPVLRFYDSTGKKLLENNDWGGSLEIRDSFSRLGASPLAAQSKDAAISALLQPGVYTAHLTSSGAEGGVALVECYDADDNMANRLANVSARSEVLTGENILIAGFVISGSEPKTVLIRGLGPTLVTAGVAGALADPVLSVFDSIGIKLDENDDWAGTPLLSAAFVATGAGALVSPSSKDAALLVTLQPGAYTAQVSGAGGTTGVGLVEIFELQ
jgi:sugar lactone lactonase YvrE